MNFLSPTPVRPPLKRTVVDDLGPELERAPKRRRSRSPVVSWLSNISTPSQRAQSAPAKFDSSKIPVAIRDLSEELMSYISIDEMLRGQRDESLDQGSTRSSSRTSRTKIKTSDPKYRSVLENNYIYIDRSGMEAPDAITTIVQTQLYKPRTSQPLSQEVLLKTVKQTDQWADSTENVVNRLLDTPMFPLDRPGQQSVAFGWVTD